MAGGYSQRDSGQDHSADNEALAAARKLRSRDAKGIVLSLADQHRIWEASAQANASAEARKQRDPIAEAQEIADRQKELEADARKEEVAKKAKEVADEVAARSPQALRSERVGGKRVEMKATDVMVALGGDDKPAADSGDWTQQYMGRPAAETVVTPPAEGNWLQRQLAKLKPKKTE